MLLTIPTKVNPTLTSLIAKADATVKGGANANLNFGGEQQLAVQLDASNPSNNQVTYLDFEMLDHKPADIKRSVLAVSGKVETGNQPYRLHVYAIPQQKGWNSKSINWNNALLLDRKEALIQSVGKDAFVAGEIAFDGKERYHYLDVTDILKKHGNDHLTFVLVRETRQLGDDEDKGRKVSISSSKAVNKPKLQIWK